MIAWLVETLIATSGLMLLVLIIRDPVRQTFGARVAYALWLLPALRMVMPPLSLLPISMVVPADLPVAGLGATGALTELVRTRMTDLQVAQALPAQGTDGFPVVAALAGLWLAGAAVFALWQMLSYRRFCRQVLAHAARRRSPARGINLMASPHVQGPVAFGLRRRFIVFPKDAMTRFDVEEHAMALAHELAHHRRGDLIANSLALGFLALHWCNPIAWYAYRAFRADQEMACDADVIGAIRDRGLGHAYGRALVKCASGGALSAVCHLNSVNRLKRRLSMLSRKSPSMRRRLAGVTLTGAVMIAGLALTASGEGMAAQVGAKVSEALPIPRNADLLPSLPAVSQAVAAVSHDAAREAASAEQDARAAQLEARAVAQQARAAKVEARAAQAEARAAAAEARAARVAMAPDMPEPPLPPAPPEPPLPPAHSSMRTPPSPPTPPSVAYSWGDKYRHVRVTTPTRAEIDATVPIVEVRQGSGCSDSKSYVDTHESTVRVDGRERKKISIRICGEDMERHARMSAVRGLQQARADIARNPSIPEQSRARMMRDLDRQVDRLRARD
ncbi:M56 family metallopeptidase [Sphingobium lignivorans]|uniref:Beta-lactamase regulating signal transducer with metallopeptidase domain n=1 Tax=Sphingobium lignivorans TaxID=2735886 RepID=A0ABR6NEK8_9SPHN|nr:M56 family metallopeptidase [Sphingobium lignivorans]MBB5985714.1 beta-lactamase regulating signal transducer with metallopeptidase domain [Sphingobium lignivorans]